MLMDFSDGCAYPKSYKFVHHNCGAPIEMITGCKARFDFQCPTCAKKWRRKVSRKIYDGIQSFRNPIFLTLTLTKRRCSLDRMKSIWGLRKDLFRRVRSAGYKIRGWVGVVEYPNHLHLVMDSEYIPQQQVSKIWKAVTGDSYIVDIRRVGNRAGPSAMARYLAKYLGKSTGWPESVAMEMKSFHIMQSHGLPKVVKHKLVYPCCGQEGGFVWVSEQDFYCLPDYSGEVKGEVGHGSG